MIFSGMFLIFQAVIILVISFFVLLGTSRANSKGLRQFGRILAFTLWMLAVYLFILSVYMQNMPQTYFYKAGFLHHRHLER